MAIDVVLKNGKKRAVEQMELQYLLVTEKVKMIKRSDGWTDIDHGKKRKSDKHYVGRERRKKQLYSTGY